MTQHRAVPGWGRRRRRRACGCRSGSGVERRVGDRDVRARSASRRDALVRVRGGHSRWAAIWRLVPDGAPAGRRPVGDHASHRHD